METHTGLIIMNEDGKILAHQGIEPNAVFEDDATEVMMNHEDKVAYYLMISACVLALFVTALFYLNRPLNAVHNFAPAQNVIRGTQQQVRDLLDSLSYSDTVKDERPGIRSQYEVKMKATDIAKISIKRMMSNSRCNDRTL